jgi:predicted nucleotidyltransferase
MISDMTTAATSRKTLLETELTRYVNLLRERENLKRILVFGSLVTGEVHPWSDIDLVIVQDTDLPFWQRLREIRRLLQPKVGTDILVYTPGEWEEMKEERPFFRQEILNKSKTLYERKQ